MRLILKNGTVFLSFNKNNLCTSNSELSQGKFLYIYSECEITESHPLQFRRNHSFRTPLEHTIPMPWQTLQTLFY